MPIRMKPVKWAPGEDESKYKNVGGFKYDIIKKGTVHLYEKFLKHFLGDTVEEAESTYKEFSYILNLLSNNYYSTSTGIDKVDLFGEALIGLARAKRDFDPKRSTNFKTFAIYKIKDALNEYVRSFSAPISTPAYLKNANRNLNKLDELLSSAGVDVTGIDCTDIDVPHEIKEKYNRLIYLLENEARRAGISLNKLIERTESIPPNMTTDDEIDTDDRAEEKIYAALLVEKLKSYMTETELIISDMIMKEKTFEEIGIKFNKTAPWVTQQVAKMRDKLKRKI